MMSTYHPITEPNLRQGNAKSARHAGAENPFYGVLEVSEIAVF